MSKGIDKEIGGLVLSLKHGQAIMVGDTKVTVNLGDYRGTIKLYVQAPKDVNVERVGK